MIKPLFHSFKVLPSTSEQGLNKHIFINLISSFCPLCMCLSVCKYVCIMVHMWRSGQASTSFLTKLFESGSLVTYLCVCQTSCSIGPGEFSPLHLPSCHRDISITATKYSTRICFLLPLCCDKLQKQPGEKLIHFFLQLHGSRGRHSGQALV